jgi:hypothetical protein
LPCRLINRYTSVHLHDEFLEVDDINLLPSGRQKCSSVFLITSSKARKQSLYHSGGRPLKNCRSAPALELRFLVDVAITDFAPTPFAVTPEKDHADGMLFGMSAWQEEMERALIRQTKLSGFTLGEPLPLNDAILSGVSIYYRLGVILAATSALAKTTEKKKLVPGSNWFPCSARPLR